MATFSVPSPITAISTNVAAKVNGTAAQEFRVYDTTDGVTNIGYLAIQDRPGNLDYFVGVVNTGTAQVRGLSFASASSFLVYNMGYNGVHTFLVNGSPKVNITTRGFNLQNYPTSSAGLSSGDVYSNAGILTIVP